MLGLDAYSCCLVLRIEPGMLGILNDQEMYVIVSVAYSVLNLSVQLGVNWTF